MAFEWQKSRPEAEAAYPSGGEDAAAVARPQQPQASLSSVLDEGSEFDGRYVCGRDLRISGRAKGEIECRGTLTIDPMGQVTAKVDAVNAYVAGAYEGTMTCSGRVELASDCRVSGEITAAALVVHERARITGRVQTTGGGAQLLDFERERKGPEPAAEPLRAVEAEPPREAAPPKPASARRSG